MHPLSHAWTGFHRTTVSTAHFQLVFAGGDASRVVALGTIRSQASVAMAEHYRLGRGEANLYKADLYTNRDLLTLWS